MRFISFQFSHGVLHHSLTGDLSLVRYVWNVFHVLLGCAFVFGLRTKKTNNLRWRPRISSLDFNKDHSMSVVQVKSVNANKCAHNSSLFPVSSETAGVKT